MGKLSSTLLDIAEHADNWVTKRGLAVQSFVLTTIIVLALATAATALILVVGSFMYCVNHPWAFIPLVFCVIWAISFAHMWDEKRSENRDDL